jgi:hypothetical protein
MKQHEEKKKTTEQLGNISEEENLSAEEVDSDDMGEDITQKRQALPQQQQLF